MLLADIAEMIETAGLGSYDPDGVTGNVFMYTMPPKPDAAIGLFLSGGRPPDPKLGYDYPSVQIRVRGQADPRSPANIAESLLEAFHGLSGVVLPSGAYMVSCTAEQSTPVYIGKDGSGRHEFTVNLSLHIRNTTTDRE